MVSVLLARVSNKQQQQQQQQQQQNKSKNYTMANINKIMEQIVVIAEYQRKIREETHRIKAMAVAAVTTT